MGAEQSSPEWNAKTGANLQKASLKQLENYARKHNLTVRATGAKGRHTKGDYETAIRAHKKKHAKKHPKH